MRTMLRIAFLGLLASGSPALAQQAPPMTLSDAPRVLLRQVHAGQTVEQFVAEVLKPMRQHGRNHASLDAADAARLERVLRAEARANRVRAILVHDLDGDGRVTRAEVLESLHARQTGIVTNDMINMLADEIMKADRNGDGAIDQTELLAMTTTLTAGEEAQVSSLRALVSLAPDHAPAITASQLAAKAWRTFMAADADGNGVIDEHEAARAAQAARSFRGRPLARS